MEAGLLKDPGFFIFCLLTNNNAKKMHNIPIITNKRAFFVENMNKLKS